jgi:uncharacterized protein YwgA
VSDVTDLALILGLFGSHSSKRIEGRTRIQKLSCILKYRYDIPFKFIFKPYFYGPYSDELSEDINTLIGMKLIDESISYVGNGYYRYDYMLTKKAEQIVKELEHKLPNIMEKIDEQVKSLEQMNTPELVKLAKETSGIQSIR